MRFKISGDNISRLRERNRADEHGGSKGRPPSRETSTCNVRAAQEQRPVRQMDNIYQQEIRMELSWPAFKENACWGETPIGLRVERVSVTPET